MKVARYVGGGQIAIVEEPIPACPPGGLLVRTEASGLCSGELMDWYMEGKIPHVLGHEVAGIVVESQSERFPAGTRVVPHHHASCGTCELCLRGAHVHCPQWKRTRLIPGGMAEYFAVSAENLMDTHATDLAAEDAALMEPLACVVKSLMRLGIPWPGSSEGDVAVLGLGVMGLMHALLSPGCLGIDPNPARRDWAAAQGVRVAESGEPGAFHAVVVCPGTPAAVEDAIRLAAPDATIVLFSPLGPPGRLDLPFDDLYFRDVRLVMSYSCGPQETKAALSLIEEGRIRGTQVVSHLIGIDDLPQAYQAMKRGEILKPMVRFST